MDIAQTISMVEKFYQGVTGQQMTGNETSHPIQPNVDPIALLESHVQNLTTLLQDPVLTQHLRPWTPPMSVWESDDRFLIRMDLPSISKEEVDITLRGNVLYVVGHRRNLPQVAGFMPRHMETTVGQFQRVIQMPFDNFTPEISTNMKDGVLEITLLKPVVAERNANKKTSGKSVQ